MTATAPDPIPGRAQRLEDFSDWLKDHADTIGELETAYGETFDVAAEHGYAILWQRDINEAWWACSQCGHLVEPHQLDKCPNSACGVTREMFAQEDADAEMTSQPEVA